MKVLWLTNTPVGASEYFGQTKTSGGWMSALETHIKEQDGISLGVCFFYNKSKEFRFEHKSVTYYPVRTKHTSFLGRIKSKLFNLLDDSNQPQLLKVIEDFKPDVIQLFGSESGLGEVLNKIDIPHIIHIQGLIKPCLAAWFPKGVSQRTILSNSTLINRLLKKGIIGEYYKMKKMVVREEKILGTAKNFFGRTDWDKRVVQLYNPTAAYYHCDELLRHDFYGSQWGANTTKRLTFATTINPNLYKGLDIILKTAYLLKEKLEIHFEWKVIGMQANDDLIRVIERIEGKRFADNNVVFLGYQNAGQLIENLLSSDIFIHPSHIDNSPNSVCEAMVLGMPVLAGNVGGVPSLIENHVNGILYNSGDPFELAAIIKEINSDNERLKKLGGAARATAIKRHNAPNIIDVIKNTYSTLLNKDN